MSESEFEYTIEMGWDSYVSAGYAAYVASTPEEAIAKRGVYFHPDADSVVRRKVGTEKWYYEQEDQKFDRVEKLEQYRAALEERELRHDMYRPRKSSALPNNRGVKTAGPFIKAEEGPVIWYYEQGELNVRKFDNYE